MKWTKYRGIKNAPYLYNKRFWKKFIAYRRKFWYDDTIITQKNFDIYVHNYNLLKMFGND